MFGRRKSRESNASSEEFDLRKRVYMKVSERKRISIDQLVQEIETEYIHRDEIEKKLDFLMAEGFIHKETEEGTDLYMPVE